MSRHRSFARIGQRVRHPIWYASLTPIMHCFVITSCIAVSWVGAKVPARLLPSLRTRILLLSVDHWECNCDLGVWNHIIWNLESWNLVLGTLSNPRQDARPIWAAPYSQVTSIIACLDYRYMYNTVHNIMQQITSKKSNTGGSICVQYSAQLLTVYLRDIGGMFVILVISERLNLIDFLLKIIVPYCTEWHSPMQKPNRFTRFKDMTVLHISCHAPTVWFTPTRTHARKHARMCIHAWTCHRQNRWIKQLY